MNTQKMLNSNLRVLLILIKTPIECRRNDPRKNIQLIKLVINKVPSIVIH